MDQNIFLSPHDAGHVAGDRARTFMSFIATRASSLIIVFLLYLYYVINKESFLYTKTETCINLNKNVACKVSIDSH